MQGAIEGTYAGRVWALRPSGHCPLGRAHLRGGCPGGAGLEGRSDVSSAVPRAVPSKKDAQARVTADALGRGLSMSWES